MNRHLSYALLAALAIVTLVLAGRASAGPAVKLAVIVAKGSPITNLSKAELKRAYLSDNVVIGGKKLVPFNFSPNTPERTGFDKVVLGMSVDVMQRFWIDRKIRGQPDAPRSLPSAVMAIKITAKFPGAIAYIPSSDLTADVQAVTIDGVAHDSPSYDISM